ncbi:TonB-dependent receptor [Allosphingosinicella deserti]|uniref:TonB-dependent receptor n=1 Tax=Allosphingosinicella deserti TaxID=2116704 RepID=A0A2P7QGA1_9SPHN|nr:TonB-dependent receptor [Sphingomonas deserti]PSJ36994.1 TonB-dependent receptor [Sphingomonas deserti]
MNTESARPVVLRRALLAGTFLLAGTAWPAIAQSTADVAPDQTGTVQNQGAGALTEDGPAAITQTSPEDAGSTPGAEAGEDIVITGFRRSLQSSTNARRESVGFSDSIFAEDIGKFPDTNIAESFNRIPGVTISREVTGEGLNVAIRGLGTNFTRVLLNGAPVAIASSGRTDAQSTNREVDLDLLPTELFTQLTVNKSPLASMVEGGAAGTVNMRSARPFDSKGSRLTYSFQGTKNSEADDWGQRGSIIASTTMGNFGILVGAAGVRNKVNTTGFETIGWTNPNLSTPQSLAGSTGNVPNVPTAANILAAQCRSTPCNTTGGGNWTIPGAVPANAGNGLIPGTQINQDFLLARNPGLTIQQLDNGLLPRLGRPSENFGTRARYNGIVALEWRPSDALHFYVDSMYGKRKNDLQRIDVNWIVRNGAAVPLNMTVDREDCAQGCVVTGGTFANSQFFLEYRPFIERTTFWGVNPGIEWQLADDIKLDLQGNYNKSRFHRESPTALFQTAPSSGVTVEYSNDGGIPSIVPNIDLNDPANYGWNGGRVNIQDERRRTESKGVRGSLTYGDEDFNVRVGGAFDDIKRRIQAFDNSQAWQNAVCGNNPNVFLPSPNTQPPCQGLNQPGAAPPGYPTYPGLGTGFSSGIAGPVVYQGSLVPNAAVPSYLVPGPNGFVRLDWDRFKQATNYDSFHDNAPEAGSANTGASGGYVREKNTGLFIESNGKLELGGNELRYNVGVRYVRTDQTIGGLVSLPDPRNVVPANIPPGQTQIADGSRYPNITNFVTTNNKYNNWLPSLTLAYNIGGKAIARVALSKTMTRPDPNAQLPGVNFSTPSADVGSIGNPALDPYVSKNIDLGLDYFTGGEGIISVAAFRKKLTGFTTNGTTTVPFSALSVYGITFDTLAPAQQAAINARGGPGAATVVLQQQVNATGTLTVNGLEFGIVQPLDFLLGRYLGINGFGVSGNLTIIDQKGTGAAPATALGVAEYTYNLTAYYENHGVSARLSTTFNKGSQVSGTNQNGIPLAALFSDDYQQWDFSSSLNLEEIFGRPHLPEVTFDVINLFKADQRSYFQFENATFTQYNPGRTIMVGLRGRF